MQLSLEFVYFATLRLDSPRGLLLQGVLRRGRVSPALYFLFLQTLPPLCSSFAFLLYLVEVDALHGGVHQETLLSFSLFLSLLLFLLLLTGLPESDLLYLVVLRLLDVLLEHRYLGKQLLFALLIGVLVFFQLCLIHFMQLFYLLLITFIEHFDLFLHGIRLFEYLFLVLLLFLEILLDLEVGVLEFLNDELLADDLLLVLLYDLVLLANNLLVPLQLLLAFE